MKTTHIQHYKVIIEKGEDGQFVGRIPSLPGCVTQAKTYEGLIKRAKEAIQLCLEVAAEDRRYGQATKAFSSVPTFIGIEDVAVRV